ncbi:hypothetical protein MNR01_02405 [Lysobacter sp. S4-A87]|uniref:hypothetical protein n=1 Tax=Lysobacter sp. S4-A87 TaxID=2925843 RepID=UPI001F531FD7|nr:hypothetical protein [Lysobacter sp. S4-A87]UNK49910.1 hypothetical protein MNR01_02405 [Lysobacter sp. S4-A87]
MVGRPGLDGDALYVFQAKYGTKAPKGRQLDEVTDEYWNQMRAEVWPRFQAAAPVLAAELLSLSMPEDQLFEWLCAPTRETGTTPVELLQSGREQDVHRLILWLSAGFLG